MGRFWHYFMDNNNVSSGYAYATGMAMAILQNNNNEGKQNA